MTIRHVRNPNHDALDEFIDASLDVLNVAPNGGDGARSTLALLGQAVERQFVAAQRCAAAGIFTVEE